MARCGGMGKGGRRGQEVRLGGGELAPEGNKDSLGTGQLN